MKNSNCRRRASTVVVVCIHSMGRACIVKLYRDKLQTNIKDAINRKMLDHHAGISTGTATNNRLLVLQWPIPLSFVSLPPSSCVSLVIGGSWWTDSVIETRFSNNKEQSNSRPTMQNQGRRSCHHGVAEVMTPWRYVGGVMWPPESALFSLFISLFVHKLVLREFYLRKFVLTKYSNNATRFLFSIFRSIPGHQISWVSDWVRDFCPWASSAMEAATETKFGKRLAYGMRMMPELQIHA